MLKKNLAAVGLLTFIISIPSLGKAKKNNVIKSIEEKEQSYQNIARQIWSWAEVGYQEYKSSKLLQETLKGEGFSIESGVADIPTAFVASYGSGKPVIAILAEFDALPGLSQKASAIHPPSEPQTASGHRPRSG